MNSTDLAFTSALEQARLIRQKEISPLELTELYLSRIEQLNPQLGSFVYVATDQAIADATAKTEDLTTLDPDELPPFFGVPIPIKDLAPVAGMPCTYGLRILKNSVAEADSGVVGRIKQAGFVILGKTATSEAGTLPYTETRGFLPVRNPWHLDYTAGGSSGGAASALAAGLCPVAHGSDGGGSIRGPAFCCGLVGIKPSRGRVTMAPVGERLNGAAVEGPLGRTVADAAALLDVMAGYEPGDPYWLPYPGPSFLAATQQTVKPLRIGVMTEIAPVGEADPLCKEAVHTVATLLESLGHQIEPAPNIDFTELIDPFTTVFRAVLAEAGVPPIFLNKMNRWWWVQAQLCSCGQYLRAVTKMQKLAREIVKKFESVDVLLLPTYMHPTIRVGEWARLNPSKTLEKIIEWIAPCPPFNASGQPAIALPTGLTPNGLPMGVQLVGKPAAETTLIALAAQLEPLLWQAEVKRPVIATQI
ncbi:MAG TPA: amidase [Leptolyngbyaceae cyanobacterium M33_DOE_097]|uniref:Amidase n=1 Tax=Oscillatoriales cyanobacterium SpSt-418 TaxID=2282169 RepID=A0A7C3PGG4_9CYAN|nr:amidase [Leptolyngbyaceae cyanobacterium M33_DOE_097]